MNVVRTILLLDYIVRTDTKQKVAKMHKYFAKSMTKKTIEDFPGKFRAEDFPGKFRAEDFPGKFRAEDFPKRCLDILGI